MAKPNGHSPARARRVLYLTDLHPADKFGSLEEQILVLAKSLPERGGALIPVFGAPVGQETANQYGEIGLLPTSLDLHSFSLPVLRRLLQLVRENEIEVIHWNFYHPINPYVWALSAFSPGIRHYITDHNSRIPSEELSQGKLSKLFKKMLLRRYKRVLCISDFVESCLKQQEVWPELSRCTYFINTDRFRPNAVNRKKYRDRLNVSDDKFVILFVGKLIKWKGGETAIKALTVLPESTRLVVIGHGEWLPVMEALVSDANLSQRVHFLGPQRNVEPYMQAADCLLCPSIWEEAVGLVNIEALATGLPVVASRVGGIPEFIEEGKTGLLFTSGNHLELAERIRYLMDNPKALMEMSRNGRAAALEKFSIERRIQDYFEIYGSN
jgi:L-malate glycosyltransferase